MTSSERVSEYAMIVVEAMQADAAILERVREMVAEVDLSSDEIAVAHCRVVSRVLNEIADSGRVTGEDRARMQRMFSTLAALGWSPA